MLGDPFGDHVQGAVSRLMAASTIASLFDEPAQLLEFAEQAISALPGVARCWADDQPARVPEGAYRLPLRTADHNFGVIVVEPSRQEVFETIQPIIGNFVNTLAVHLENRDYRRATEQRLKQEQQALKLSKDFFASVFEGSNDVIAVLKPDYTLVQVNTAMRRLVGLPEDVEIGENVTCHQMLFHRSEPCPHCPATRTSATRSPEHTTVPFPDAEDPRIWLDLSCSPVLDTDGETGNLVLVGRDVTELKRFASDKEILLKEIHHRVKNNLNVVVSLLNLQLGAITDPDVQQALHVSVSRVRAIGLVHQSLYRSRTQSSVDLKPFLQDFISDFVGINQVDSRIRIESDIQATQLHIDLAVPVSLVINELMTNAFKYAFPGSREGQICVATRVLQNHEIELSVTDDGVGLPAGFDPTRAQSLGMRLVCALTEQLHGRVSFDPGNLRGTAVRITFPGRS